MTSVISAALGHQHGYQDALAAKNALEWLTGYLEGHLRKCLQTESTGLCDMTWRHDHCALLMSILYDITQDEKYMVKY